jgi:hypothetical protein
LNFTKKKKSINHLVAPSLFSHFAKIRQHVNLPILTVLLKKLEPENGISLVMESKNRGNECR